MICRDISPVHGGTETAWRVCEPTSIRHGQRSRRLVQMAGRFAMVRGSAIECFGSGDLVRATVLKARGIAVAPDPTELRELLGGLSGDALMAAAPACTDAAGFHRWIGERRALHGRPVPGTPHGGDAP